MTAITGNADEHRCAMSSIDASDVSTSTRARTVIVHRY
jgi:hypothetical protein